MRIFSGTAVLIGLSLATSCTSTSRQTGSGAGGGAGEDGSGGSSSTASGGTSADGGTGGTTSSSSNGGDGGTSGTSTDGSSTGGSSTGGSSMGGSASQGGSAGTSGGTSGAGGAGGAGGGSSTGGSGGTGGGGTGGAGNCGAIAVEDNAASGQTVAADNELSPSCGNGSSPELIFEWTAPYSDYFMFDSAGSDFDTVVTLLSECSGTELVCNNTAPGATPQGLAVAKVAAGETYWVAVEGNNGETGEVNLAIAPVACPSADLTGQPLPATFSTVGGTTEHEARCTGQEISPQSEKTIRYVPESAGMYRFSASSSDFRVLLSLYDGAMCGGEYLQCSYGQVGSGAYPAEVTRYLEADQAVTLVIEGEDGVGEFEVDIQRVDNGDVCDNIPELGTGQSGTISPNSDDHVLSSSCNWAGNSYGSYAEHLYRFTVNQPAGGANCYVSLDESTGSIETYILAGDHCEGAEFECEATGNYHAFSRNDNGVYTLVIENRDPFHSSGSYTISSTCE